MKSFRCRSCGFLETSGQAAHDHFPHACPVCSRGVEFGPSLDAILARAHLEPHRAALAGVQADVQHDPGKRLLNISLPGHPSFKFFHHENWEVLADATPERLAELGLTPDQVERHEPWPRGSTGRPAQHVHAGAADGPATLDGAKAG